jgi:hypothetical protein
MGERGAKVAEGAGNAVESDQGRTPGTHALRHPLRHLDEFAEVASAWDALPDPIRAAMLALVRTTR